MKIYDGLHAFERAIIFYRTSRGSGRPAQPTQLPQPHHYGQRKSAESSSDGRFSCDTNRRITRKKQSFRAPMGFPTVSLTDLHLSGSVRRWC